MDPKRLYIQTRRDASSGSFVEVVLVESNATEITILVTDKDLAKRTHTEIYHKADDGSFVRQMFQIIKSKKSRAGILLRLSRVSATKAAETRQFTRVSTEAIRARFGDQDGCRVLDISATGIAIVSTERFELGDLVTIVLHHNGANHAGVAKVMSIRDCDADAFRYGLCSSHGVGGAADELSRELPKITMQLQLLSPHHP